MRPLQYLHLDPSRRQPLLRPEKAQKEALPALPVKKIHTSPLSAGDENASVFFIGNATTVIEWQGLRILTDPNFLHAGDHVHLGPGVTAKRLKNPALDVDELPPVDVVLLSHYHEDHFDRLVEESLNRDFPIVSTPHAKGCLESAKDKEEPFRNVTALDFFESTVLLAPKGDGDNRPVVKVTGMPGKHFPPGALSVMNDLLNAVPPTNGWMVELGYSPDIPVQTAGADDISTGYRIYISGDTLFVDELKQIPQWLNNEKIDLMLVHLGGTSIPGPSAPLVMVTMDGKQGLQLMRLLNPKTTIPIHFDDYDVMVSSLDDFKKEVEEGKMADRVVYLERGEEYRFKVRK